MTASKAVHFGAGNIGRGFVGLLLHKAGFEVVFADVNAELIDALSRATSYRVHEVGFGARDWIVTNFRAVNSAENESQVVAEIAEADIVTTAVGPNVLRFVAPLIARAIEARAVHARPLVVMACENAINATSILRDHVAGALANPRDAERAIFANTAVDRIVPSQSASDGLTVTVEAFFEWAIEATPFGTERPTIPDAHFVQDLSPFIERKLFTVNTGHAATAYFGRLAGVESIAAALGNADINSRVRAVLGETSELLIAKHHFDVTAHADYVETILRRFANTELDDSVLRVGREPLRKLSRNERFIAPAAELAERGIQPRALLAAIAAALRFDGDPISDGETLRAALGSSSAEGFISSVMGLDSQHPLFDLVLPVVRARMSELTA